MIEAYQRWKLTVYMNHDAEHSDGINFLSADVGQTITEARRWDWSRVELVEDPSP
jgi:hypothetical protein